MTTLEVNILGHSCLFDREDYFAWARYGFGVSHDSSGFYYLVLNSLPYRSQRFHRLLMKASSDVFVDHKNRNTLDNRKDNLRLVTPSQSAANREVTWGNNRLQGAYKQGTLWKSQISVNGKRIYLGLFRLEEQAHEAYKKAQQKYFGEFGLITKTNAKE